MGGYGRIRTCNTCFAFFKAVKPGGGSVQRVRTAHTCVYLFRHIPMFGFQKPTLWAFESPGPLEVQGGNGAPISAAYFYTTHLGAAHRPRSQCAPLWPLVRYSIDHPLSYAELAEHNVMAVELRQSFEIALGSLFAGFLRWLVAAAAVDCTLTAAVFDFLVHIILLSQIKIKVNFERKRR